MIENPIKNIKLHIFCFSFEVKSIVLVLKTSLCIKSILIKIFLRKVSFCFVLNQLFLKIRFKITKVSIVDSV